MTRPDTIKARREEAEKVLNEINKVSFEIDKIHKSIQNVLSQSHVVKGTIDNKNRILIDVISKSDRLIEAYRSERDRIKVVTRQIDKYYQKSFTPLLAKINDPETGFKSKISENARLSKEVKKIRNQADSQFVRLKKLVDEYKTKINSLRTIEKPIIRINKEAKLYDSNISKVNKIANEIKAQIVEKKESILESEKEVSQLEIQVKKDSSTVMSLLDSIHNYEQEANQTLEKIKTIYQIASNTGLGGAFNERKKEYEIDLEKWQNWVLYSTIALAIVVVAIYVIHLCQYWGEEIEYNVDFYIRFFLTSPLVFYLTFSANQYNRAKKNHEKYSLRTTVALSIESHLELLAKNPQYLEKENVDKILDFIINTFINLYEETYTKEKKSTDNKLEKEYIDDKFEMVLDLLQELTKIKVGS